jgi:hypothetical protein
MSYIQVWSFFFLLLNIDTTDSLPYKKLPSCRCGNVAAILELDENLNKQFRVFEAAPHVCILHLWYVLPLSNTLSFSI